MSAADYSKIEVEVGRLEREKGDADFCAKQYEALEKVSDGSEDTEYPRRGMERYRMMQIAEEALKGEK